MKILASSNSSEQYFTVCVTNPGGYGPTHSPKFSTKGECYQWIDEQLFDNRATVYIEEVSKEQVPREELLRHYEGSLSDFAHSYLCHYGYVSISDIDVDKAYTDAEWKARQKE